MLISEKSKCVNRATAVMSGSRIGVAAPAGKLDPVSFNNGLRWVRWLGYRIAALPNIAAGSGYLAGSDAERAARLNRLFADPGLAAVLCARGGYGTMRVLPLLDWDALRRYPKVVMGYSDITALLTAVYQRCHLATLHGPVVTGLGRSAYRTVLSMQKALQGCSRRRIFLENPFVLTPGQASGPLIGGNLTTLCHLLATPWMPDFNGHIVFLEDIDEPIYRVDRMLTQMKLAGCFESIVGLVLGRFTRCGPLHAINALFDQAFGHLHVPIVSGLPVGHEGVNVTLPIGVMAWLNTDDGYLTVATAVQPCGSAE